MNRCISLCILLLALTLPSKAGPLGPEYKFIQSEHFILHYYPGLENAAKRIGVILERLYGIYTDTYDIVLPDKTEIVVPYTGQSQGGFALALNNMMAIWPDDLDWNLRGTHDWLEDVVTHEYAHIVSITAGHKWHRSIPYFQFGYFSF